MSNHVTISRLIHLRRLLLQLAVFTALILPFRALAHPMPNSLVLLDIRPATVTAELQLPLSELQLAFGHNVAGQANTLVTTLGTGLRTYLLAHMQAVSPDGRSWQISIQDMEVQPIQESVNGPYQELRVHCKLQPPPGASTRNFTLYYDAIVHQEVTHKILVSIRQDWENGITAATQPATIGVIKLDVQSGTIPPLVVNQDEGSLWQGFKSMIGLGMQHIAEGTDHLLFLLVLLLPAPLLSEQKRWGGFGGVKYGVMRLLKIVSAFTIGHSFTLLAGAAGLVRLPQQPIEVLILVSIIVSAIHALRPVFPGRETLIAGGFGLVHGLAFAATLAELHLDTTRMALSILGFNMGIELAQLLIVACTVPWLMLLSRTAFYRVVRPAGAILAIIAALAWMVGY